MLFAIINTVTNSNKSEQPQTLSAPVGSDFDPRFKPELTPKQMLQLGVFGGSYLNDSLGEYPPDWLKDVRLSDHGPDSKLNYFEVLASQPLKVWQAKGWIHKTDPMGWFQWYCRYYLGRRLPQEDDRQIKRWAAMKRHVSQIQKNCNSGDQNCRPRQRQALLHWAYDSRSI